MKTLLLLLLFLILFPLIHLLEAGFVVRWKTFPRGLPHTYYHAASPRSNLNIVVNFDDNSSSSPYFLLNCADFYSKIHQPLEDSHLDKMIQASIRSRKFAGVYLEVDAILPPMHLERVQQTLYLLSHFPELIPINFTPPPSLFSFSL